MSISLNANFELLSAGLYLDARQQFNTIIEMKDFAETSIPDGFITYNKETQKHYVFNSSNTIDATLGKWREYNSGDSSSTTYATWDSNVDYKVGNVVLKDEVRYSCIADHTSTDFETDSINWVVVLEQYYHVTQEQYNKMVSDGLITDSTKDLYIIDGNSEGGNGGENIIAQQVYSNTPIGTVLSFAGQIAPNGYLLCDGSSYAVADYQDLYDVIGNTYGGDTENFNVPDYRETVLVGVGENTTDTIAEHDVYELGEFKDDQLQGHKHIITQEGGNASSNVSPNSHALFGGTAGSSNTTAMKETCSDATNGTPRVGTTTHGKQKGVTYIIKAFHTNEGVDETVELTDTVINHIDTRIESKINEVSEQVTEQVNHILITSTEYPTTETCPVGCWYGMYFE